MGITKNTDYQPHNKCPAFYCTWNFIIVFTTVTVSRGPEAEDIWSISQMRNSGQAARTGAVEQGSRGIYNVGSRCQATSSVNWKCALRVVANIKLLKIVERL